MSWKSVAIAVSILPFSAAAAQPSQWRLQKPDDRFIAAAPQEAARELYSYSACVVANRYSRARTLALAKYGSPEQSKAAGKVIVSRDDPCLYGALDEMRLRFAPPVLAGGLAQALILKDYPDLPAVLTSGEMDVSQERAQLAQLNAAEVFGRCVVRRDPAAVFRLLKAVPATPAESEAVKALSGHLGPCLASGSTLKINYMFLRNSTAVAAYRMAQQTVPRGAASVQR